MTTQQHVDENGIMVSDEVIERIVARVLERLDEAQRTKAYRTREAILAQLRAHEDFYGLTRAIPTKAEREGLSLPKREHHNR